VTIVIRLPDELKSLEAPIRSLLEVAETHAARFEHGTGRVDYYAAEEEVGEAVAALERGVHAELLQALVVDAEEIMVDGQRYRRVVESRGTYFARAGAVSLDRPLYRAKRNGPTVDPVALRAGAIRGGWLPATADAMAHLVQLGTSREAEEAARRMGRARYSRSAYEDVAHAVGEAYQADKIEIDDAWIVQLEVPRKARSLSASLDRVSVPIAVERPRPVGRPKKGAPKRPVEVVYRMAYCATLTLHDGKGRALKTLRYGAAPGDDPSVMLERALADAVVLLKERPRLRVVLVADGAPEMWNLLRTTFSPKLLGKKTVHEVLDFYHLTEKLAAAAKVALPDQADDTMKRWRFSLLNTSSAGMRILSALLRSGKRDILVGDQRPVHDAITYLENHRELLNYVAARKAGLPIGSGAVEATCKSLFAQRLKRSGARWSERGASEIIDLRAMALSGRWDFGIRMLFARRRRDVRSAA
jgi:hypothetical protein